MDRVLVLGTVANLCTASASGGLILCSKNWRLLIEFYFAVLYLYDGILTRPSPTVPSLYGAASSHPRVFCTSWTDTSCFLGLSCNVQHTLQDCNVSSSSGFAPDRAALSALRVFTLLWLQLEITSSRDLRRIASIQHRCLHVGSVPTANSAVSTVLCDG
ncbi:uncharacterized protein C8Q71DRAFT_736054 [Rhodofomes roseus]|uniref:C3H1-type domain-containing protein n=1 Tax=Rhodofomes roseus TaxID=34475 RepID=A0ABQ8KXP4_9APHY|nr:uncharacterized protein C8Q71DRAFT_736054 [Rhodofomes roseus]KAH9843143.1 hypothetical protein C8Q71DRAFT_736054 [Rhodofomes roseus]